MSNHNVLSVDRVPPHDVDAERMILGALMVADHSHETVPIAISKIQDGDFYRQAHTYIFEAISALFDQSSGIDLVTVQSQLGKMGNLEKVGGVPYLNEMIEQVPTVANLEYYIKIVQDFACKRRIIYESARNYNEAFDDEIDTQELVTEIHKRMMMLNGNHAEDVVKAKSVIKETFEHIQDLYSKGEAITGLSTGFDDLDAMTAGFQDSEYIIIGGRPSMGKSALLQAIIEHISIDQKKPTLLFSSEMSKRSVMLRLLGSIGGVSVHALRAGGLGESDWPKLTLAASKISEAPLYINDTANISIGELRAKAYQAKMQYDIKMIAVDYIQELVDLTKAKSSRQEEIASVSRQLKALARELNIPVVVASQLSRSVESRPDKRPLLSDLRESGGLEQDADVVIFLYREDYYDKESTDKTTEVIIRKQRNGPIGTVKLYFDKTRLRFENLAKNRRSDDPWG